MEYSGVYSTQELKLNLPWDTDYVVAIYLKMHATAAESLMDFHSRLVSTHTLFLANLIASRIDDKEKQWDTFAKLSLSMLGYEESSDGINHD